jgi:GGDEF domain-containing protein
MARILGELERRPLLVDGEPIRITASYGIASTEDGVIADAAGLLKAADQRLYASKEARKQEAPDV